MHEPPKALAPGYAPLAFALPAPGSYALPPLWTAGDGDVLDTSGKALRLHALLDGHYTVISFIYTRCSDVNGCPLASYVLKEVQGRLHGEPALRAQVRLLSLSFDPAWDTPGRLADYSARLRDDSVDWQFLTTRSREQLDPILKAWDQTVMRDTDAEGREIGTISHLLRVYLVDPELRIRNVYNVNFLHVDTIVNDIETLMAAEPATH